MFLEMHGWVAELAAEMLCDARIKFGCVAYSASGVIVNG